MRVSLRWLTDYVDLSLPAGELAHRLTMAGLGVDTIESSGGDWEGISVGLVTSVDPHPNADRLRLATVELAGSERMTVVCGAPNVAAGQKVAFARTGARLIDGHTGQPTVLKPAVIRGVESAGMVCSEKELGISDEHTGILVLPEEAPVGAPLDQYMGDSILNVDVTPNRPDCLSMMGVAREVAALSGGAAREPDTTYPEEGEPIEGQASVEIADSDLCSRYVATLIEGITIGPSPPWMQERLIAGGMRPINNVVDITNYVMLELGQPLHAFDFARLGNAKIIVRRATPGEKLLTLDDTERALTPDTLVIADAEVPVALAGVMGGLDSEVTESTTTVLLESANFNPVSIRRTAMRLRARSEASSRFEKGLSPELTVVAARRATKLIVELGGGRAARGIIDVYPRKAREVTIELPRDRLRRVLGVDLPASRVREVLTSLGFSCHSEGTRRYTVGVPYWRTDVHIADDVVEEVARIVGYDQLPTSNLGGQVPPVLPQPLRDLRERARDLLASAGMQEVITYSLTTLEALQRVLAPEELAAHPPLRTANPLSADLEFLRTTLRASLLQTIANNLRHWEGEIALFEAARVYLRAGEDLPQEQEHVVGAVSGRREDRWGRPTDEGVDFYDAKGYLEELLSGLGVTPIFVEADLFGMVPGRTAQVQVEGRIIGVLGQVHAQVAAAFDIERDVYLFEVVLDELLPCVGGLRHYEPVPRFPAVVQDIALVVEQGVPAGRVQAIIEQAPLVRRAELFDVYAGQQVGADKKSLAFSVSYQAPDHTLTDQEVARAQRAILERLKREVGATLRG